MPFKCKMPLIYSLLDNVDPPKEPVDFWRAVAQELSTMIEYASSAQDPQIVISEARKAGDQYIWEFYVNDLATPARNDYNWHGQNVSQWLYAGAIVLQNGEVSRHH